MKLFSSPRSTIAIHGSLILDFPIISNLIPVGVVGLLGMLVATPVCSCEHDASGFFFVAAFTLFDQP